jgi:hypothetical protein
MTATPFHQYRKKHTDNSINTTQIERQLTIHEICRDQACGRNLTHLGPSASLWAWDETRVTLRGLLCDGQLRDAQCNSMQDYWLGVAGLREEGVASRLISTNQLRPGLRYPRMGHAHSQDVGLFQRSGRRRGG